MQTVQADSRCGGCNELLATSSEARCAAVGKMWHKRCFVCRECQSPLAGKFYDVGGHPICDKHYQVAKRRQETAERQASTTGAGVGAAGGSSASAKPGAPSSSPPSSSSPSSAAERTTGHTSGPPCAKCRLLCGPVYAALRSSDGTIAYYHHPCAPTPSGYVAPKKRSAAAYVEPTFESTETVEARTLREKWETGQVYIESKTSRAAEAVAERDERVAETKDVADTVDVHAAPAATSSAQRAAEDERRARQREMDELQEQQEGRRLAFLTGSANKETSRAADERARGHDKALELTSLQGGASAQRNKFERMSPRGAGGASPRAK